MIRYETTIAGIDWDRAAEIFRRAPLGDREPGMLSRVFQKSYAYVFVYDDESLIGLCRALSDGEYDAAIYDVVLLPEYHGRGIGREMVRILLSQLHVVNIILFATPGYEGLYRKFGFKKLLTGMGILHPFIGAPGRGFLEP